MKGIGKDKIYCNRHLGIEAIPGSDGRCGPVDGPQCSDCFEFIPQEKHYVTRETVSLEKCLQKYTYAEDLSEKVGLFSSILSFTTTTTQHTFVLLSF
jgi:hypothetical protein